jgi:hypothetical protein
MKAREFKGESKLYLEYWRKVDNRNLNKIDSVIFTNTKNAILIIFWINFSCVFYSYLFLNESFYCFSSIELSFN